MKSRITIYLDADIVARFKAMGENEKVGYQTLINESLRNVVDGMDDQSMKANLKEDLLNDKSFIRKLRAELSA